MKLEAVRHTGGFPDVTLSDRSTLIVTLRTARRDAKKCKVHYFARTTPDRLETEEMEFTYRDELFDYYRAEIHFHQIARYQKYYFEIKGDKTAFLAANGFHDRAPDDGFFEYLYANRTGIVHPPEWMKGQVFYQIFPERFANGDKENDPPETQAWGTPPTRENYMGGDLGGIIEHIDYLRELGVDCIYLNPIFEGDFNHKYATTDYFRVDPHFGTEEDLHRLVDSLHAAGIRILLDGVFNHCGIHFAPFENLLEKQEASPYREWFFVTEFPIDITHHSYECVGAYKYMPKLNTGNPEVRKYILDVMAYWIEEFHIDGWRLDVADEVDEGVWEEARLMMTERYPNTMLLGETWGSGLSLMNGRQMDAIMNYVFRDAVRDYVAAGKIDARQFMDRSMHMLSNYPEAMDQAMFLPLDSHDTERFLTLSGGDLRKHRAAVTLQMTFVGSPSIYYGDEIGMDGENDPDCRKCMNWDHPDEDLKLYYQELIWIRHQHEALRLGRIDIDLCEGRNLAYTRSLGNESITVLIHADDSEEEVRIPVKRRSRFVNLLDGEEYVAYSRDHNDTWLSDKLDYQGEMVIPMTPYGVKVLKEESYEKI